MDHGGGTKRKCVSSSVMVNGLHLYSAFVVSLATKSALHYTSAFTHSGPFIHWWLLLCDMV